MFLKAIVQAEHSLARCEANYQDAINALTKMSSVMNDVPQRTRILHEIADAWADFLMAAGRFFSKLEQGAKSDGKSDAWFGRIKNLRKKNAILRYIRHARNSDEHGIEPINEIKGPMAVIPPGGTATVIRLSENEFQISSPNNSNITYLLPSCRVMRVTDLLHKDSFDPPDLGDVEDHTKRNVERVMEASLPLIRDILVQARKLPVY